jgi:tRNA dimethylallyltransferase
VTPVVLLGATASGKSSVALAAARALGDVELVSIDALQVYRGMDIGTAKPTRAERAEVVHHGLDLVGAGDEFALAEFLRSVRATLDDLAARDHRAVCVGGTGLYLRAVVDDLELPGQFPDLRARLEVDPDLLRPVELPVLRGSHQRLTDATGWEPEIPISQTLTDLLEDWRTRLAQA